MNHDRFTVLKQFFTACSEFIPQVLTYDELDARLTKAGFGKEFREEYLHPPAAADLHLHSNYSDGKHFPRHLVWLAKLLRLRAACLADHDNISGLEEFVVEGEKTGVKVWAGVELAGGRPGFEILVYFPATASFLEYLRSEDSAELRAVLLKRQEEVHSQTMKVMKEFNSFLRSLGKTDLLTEKEVGDWYSGVPPFYPGTLCVLLLKRLSEEERKTFGVSNPREVNTKFATPVLKKLKTVSGDVLSETLRLIKNLKKQSFPSLAVLAHPAELISKGKMSLAEIEELLTDLAINKGIDGMEVNNSRDGEAESEEWLRMWQRVRRQVKLCNNTEIYAFGFSSDFHVLNPGKEAGEFTLGYGVLDEDHPQGNLKPPCRWEEFTAELPGYIL